eukprot:5483814-Ditylum_brightwellii.AAC.3
MPQKKKGWKPSKSNKRVDYLVVETRTWACSGIHLAAPARFTSHTVGVFLCVHTREKHIVNQQMKSSLTSGEGAQKVSTSSSSTSCNNASTIAAQAETGDSSPSQLLQVPKLPSVANASAIVISPGTMAQPPSMHNPYL